MDKASNHRPVTMLAATLVATALLGLACAKSATTDAANTAGTVPGNSLEADDLTPQNGGKIVMGLTAETNGWNPGKNQWADAGNFVGSSMVEPLLSFDREGNTVPWLAESVKPKSPGDFKNWTIKIKPNIKFHDDTPLDAAAVKKSLDYYASPAALASVAIGDRFSADSYTVVDPLTVDVKLTTPWASYPTNIAGPSGYIMAPAMLDAPDAGASHPIGTGPFVFQSWTPNESLKAIKNAKYWRPNEPHLEAIEFRPIPDAKARAQALSSGAVDMIFTTRAEDVVNFRDEFTVVTDYNGEKTLVMLNVLEDPNKALNPFKNIHARKALAYATNRKQIIEQVSGGLPLKSSTTFALAGTQWEIDENQTGYYPYDPAKAKEEIEKYKQETGRTDFKFVLSGLANVDDTQTLQLLQQQWKDVGMDAQIQTSEQTAYITQLVSGAFQAAFYRNYAYPDPDSDGVFLESATAKGLGVLSINFHQLKDDRIDKAFSTGRTTDDVNVRKQAYLDATKALNDQAVNIWLYNTPYSIVAVKQIHGLNPARQQGFGNFLPKPWFWVNLWKEQ